MNELERVCDALPRRALWWGLLAALALTALTAGAAWHFRLERIGSMLPWLLLAGAWVAGFVLVFACDDENNDYHPVELGLGIVNPVTVWFGGWMFAVVLWLALAVMLRAVWEDVFGWGSVDEEPPILDI